MNFFSLSGVRGSSKNQLDKVQVQPLCVLHYSSFMHSSEILICIRNAKAEVVEEKIKWPRPTALILLVQLKSALSLDFILFKLKLRW